MISTHKLTKTYSQGGVETKVLRSIDLDIKTGEFVAIMGRSGAGKSTLMYQMSLLDHPTSGTIFIDGIDVTKLENGDRTLFRLQNLGYVFQDYALIPDLTAKENVAIPLLMQGLSMKDAYAKAIESLVEIGLSDKLDFLPGKLSGGQQQRVSIARALAHNPKILFADEPTANLDSESGALVIELFREINKKGQTVIMVTHEEEYGKKADRIIRLSDGEIVL
jgi:putative ABC transport system ATP-binding protein